MRSSQTFALFTPTWRGDLVQFELLRRALTQFGHAGLTHHVIVQSEDVGAFSHLARDGVQLHATADVLPPEVEHQRQHCIARTRTWSRHRIRYARSLNKRLGWFNWIRHEGWQTQQLCKLRAADCFGEDVFVVLDSDCLPTGPYDFAALTGYNGRSIYLENWSELGAGAPGLDRRWSQTAHRLLGLQWPYDDRVLNRLGTPYVLERDTLRAMLARLSTPSQCWHERLMQQAPGSWSEFALYNAYVQHHRPPALECRPATPQEDGFVAHTDEHMKDLATHIQAAFEQDGPGFFRVQSDARYHARQSTTALSQLFDPYLAKL